MITQVVLLQYLNELLSTSKPVNDYAPNGLQVQGKEHIHKLVTGVTASQEFLEKACLAGADAVLVHHGLFWKNDSRVVVGPLYHRLRVLLQHEINLFAYHLPLDIHPVLGNNAELGKHLEIENIEQDTLLGVTDLGMHGSLKEGMSPLDFATFIKKRLGRRPLHIPGGADNIQRIAWCTGAAQDGIEWAATLGVDAYLSGEISERTTHLAREWGVHYYACGHHATERYGVQAVGEYLAKEHGLEHLFIDIENPV